jgi:hypothetical protein
MAATVDPTRLYTALLNSGLQQKDYPLYQVIYQLIGQLALLSGNVNAVVSTPSSPSIVNSQTVIINGQQRFNEQPRSPWPLFPPVAASGSFISSPEVPIVLTVDTIIDTNFGEVIPESLEISSGIQLEIQGGARLEITGQVSGIVPNNIGAPVNSAPPVIATSIPLTTFRNFAYRQAYASTAVNVGWAFNGTGTQTFVVDSRGNWERQTTAGGAGSVSGLTDTTNFIQLGNNPELLIHFRLGSDVTSQRLWIGFWSNNSTDADVNVRLGCGVRYSSVAGDTGFILQTSDGVSQNLGSTLGTIVAGDEYLIHLVVSNSGQTLTVYLEQLSTGATSSAQINVLRGALSTSLFAAQIRLIDQVAGTRFIDIKRSSIYFDLQMPAIP